MGALGLNAVRYGIPVALLIAGVQGDKERDREEEARRHFDEHRRWPD
jgi:hypothetical protein